MDADPHPHIGSARPRRSGNRILGLDGRLEGGAWSTKSEEQPVAAIDDLDALMPPARVGDQRGVQRQQLTVAVAELMQQARRALDVMNIIVTVPCGIAGVSAASVVACDGLVCTSNEGACVRISD